MSTSKEIMDRVIALGSILLCFGTAAFQNAGDTFIGAFVRLALFQSGVDSEIAAFEQKCITRYSII